jgi:hypothetical protein
VEVDLRAVMEEISAQLPREMVRAAAERIL